MKIEGKRKKKRKESQKKKRNRALLESDMKKNVKEETRMLKNAISITGKTVRVIDTCNQTGDVCRGRDNYIVIVFAITASHK